MDRISGLSDDLLVKILLLLPTKVAVSTSILSKRWEYLWMSVPKLDYGGTCCSDSESEKLQCFLDRNLPLHRAPVIESFSLDLFSSCFKPENIKMWVVTAVSRGVRELEIEYEPYPTDPDILPSNLYTCKSLVILKLVGDILLDVPTMVSLPCLKTLRLQRVTYFDDGALQRLLSNCPILEDLMLELPEYESTGKLTVVVPALQSLSLNIPYDHEIEDGVVIETPSLKYFKLVDHCDSDHYCLIGNMPNLIEAHVEVGSLDINRVIGSVTSVKRLTLCSHTMLDEGFVFDQLEHLEICLCTPLFPYQLVQLLNASSKLKRLDFSFLDFHEPHEDMDYWKEPSAVPECLLSTLQTLSWLDYTGEPQERSILGYILKRAVHLKTATINSCESDVSEFKMKKEFALSSCLNEYFHH